MINFDFIEKSLEIVSAPYFLYDFSTETFLMLYSINFQRSNFIVGLSLRIEILGKMCIAVVY